MPEKHHVYNKAADEICAILDKYNNEDNGNSAALAILSIALVRTYPDQNFRIKRVD
jgi:hypothetical protein